MKRFLSLGLLGALMMTAATAAPLNVLMIVSDDQAWTDYGFMGHPAIKTPHLDQLAAESAFFPNGYVPTSLCRASLATLLTGLYGHQHRICCNDPPDGVDRTAMLPFLQEAPTIPRLLGQQGYVSLQTGKFWEGHFSNGGFTHGMTVKGRHGDDGLVIGRQTLQPIYDFVDENPGKPFFIWYAPMMPHEPHNPPERILAKYRVPGRAEKLARYDAMCEWFDETCGEVLGWIDKKWLRETTLVVFLADNGWIQETGPQTTRGTFAPKSKLSPYDGGLRTPVLVRWPGQIKPGRHEDLVSTIDIAPTILKACGFKPADAMKGIDLVPVAQGKVHLDDRAVFGELYFHTAVDVHKTALNLTHRWVRQGDWKLIRPVDPELPAELYNLRDDPAETRNVEPMHADRAAALEKKLNQWWVHW